MSSQLTDKEHTPVARLSAAGAGAACALSAWAASLGQGAKLCDFLVARFGGEPAWSDALRRG
jgi:hypothetical protein